MGERVLKKCLGMHFALGIGLLVMKAHRLQFLKLAQRFETSRFFPF